jgi:hypothetical protein
LGGSAGPRGPDGHRLGRRYIRDWRDRKKNFELIVGQSIPEEGEACYIGSVHGYDRKPQRRIIDHLRRQGFQADQDLTFITDSGDEVRALAERISPCSEHVLVWFHITMRITVLRQFAQGLVHHDKEAGMAALDELRRIKWFLWYGNTDRARETIDGLLLDLEAQQSLSQPAQVQDSHAGVPSLYRQQRVDPDQLWRALPV